MESQLFLLLLDLLELPDQDQYGHFPELVENAEKTWKTLQIFHRYGIIFQGYLDFIAWRIQQEVFLGIGDIDSSYHPSSLSTLELWLLSLKEKKIPENRIVIFDKLLFEAEFSSSEQKALFDLFLLKKSALVLYP